MYSVLKRKSKAWVRLELRTSTTMSGGRREWFSEGTGHPTARSLRIRPSSISDFRFFIISSPINVHKVHNVHHLASGTSWHWGQPGSRSWSEGTAYKVPSSWIRLQSSPEHVEAASCRIQPNRSETKGLQLASNLSRAELERFTVPRQDVVRQLSDVHDMNIRSALVAAYEQSLDQDRVNLDLPGRGARLRHSLATASPNWPADVEPPRYRPPVFVQAP